MKKALLFLICTGSGYATMAQTPQLVQDILPGANSSEPDYKVVFNNKLYFAATDATNGRELWSYDGTTATMVYNLNPGAANGASYQLLAGMVVFNNKLYFAGDNGSSGSELYMYDGVNPPTMAFDLVPGSTGSEPNNLVAIGNRLYFSAKTAAAGRELYIFDGSNTPVLYDINPGAGNSNPSGFTGLSGNVFFAAGTVATGIEFFGYNPTNNTVMIASDIEPGSGSSNPVLGTVFNDKLYFAAKTTTHGYEFWACDGTSVTRITDVAPGALQGVGSVPYAHYGQLYFSGTTTGGDYQLYRYDPSNGTTALVYNIYPGGQALPIDFVTYAGKLYFSATNAANGREVWRYDGTTAVLVNDLNPGISSSSPSKFTVYNNQLYFSAGIATTGDELYRLNDATAIVQQQFDGSVAALPNPVTDKATLQLTLNEPMQLRIELTDAAGKVVWQQEARQFTAGCSSVMLPMGGLPAGLYFYQVRGENGSRSGGRLTKR